jgi:hypothetical protein
MRKLLPVLLLISLLIPAVADAAPRGPSRKLVRKSLIGVLHATYKESWMTDDQVKVTVSRLTILKARKRKAGTGVYDPYIWAWPVKADVRIKVCRTPTECETYRTGYWARDSLGKRTIFWFDRNTATRAWHWSAGSL